MHIEIEKTGGYGSASDRHANITTEKLPDDERNEIEEKINRIDFSKIKLKDLDDKGRDVFHYDILFENQGKKTTIVRDDLTISANIDLKSLVDYVLGKYGSPGKIQH